MSKPISGIFRQLYKPKKFDNDLVWRVKSFADQEPNKCEAFNERPHKVLVDFQDLLNVKFPLFDPP